MRGPTSANSVRIFLPAVDRPEQAAVVIELIEAMCGAEVGTFPIIKNQESADA
jgi:hypothetical protein